MLKKSILSIKCNPNNPKCNHGPTILFETTKDKYYACSAFRDSKTCSYRIKANDIIKKPKMLKLNIKTNSFKIKEFLLIDKNDRYYCHDCKRLFEYCKDKDMHKIPCIKNKHKISNISEDDINFPTRFLTASTNNKTNAQYLFSEEFLSFLIGTFHNLKIDVVICIGAPRLHETIIGERRLGNTKLISFLLDIDDRYLQFHDDSFGLYNMFNNYFMIESHLSSFHNFLKLNCDRKNVLLICDPPFGGLLQPLSTSLSDLKQLCQSNGSAVRKMFILPYFLGKKLLEFNDDLKMLDYRVTYDNHKRMDMSDKGLKINDQKSSANRRESVVRIFTDYQCKDVKPPNKINYYYCSICQRYSHKENKHCQKCKRCPTRHGPSYRHCDECGKCCQPTKKHCHSCGFCQTKDHQCEVKK